MPLTVGLVGATGAVGQRFVQLLDGHPTFTVAAVTASATSAGSTYAEATDWHLDTPIPQDIADLTVQPTTVDALPDDLDLIFSSLPSDVAADIEPKLAAHGYVVSSNSSNARLADDVPLVIPEINADHLALLEHQRRTRDWDGALVKNPNCSTITMVPTLDALEPYGIEEVHVATLQAVSGAGYDGVPSMAIIDNVIPHISGEERKMEQETTKLLGTLEDDAITDASFTVSASCNRVPTLDGHLENVWATTTDSPTTAQVKTAFQNAPTIDLHSAPDQLISVFDAPDRPQPRLDRMQANGMHISAGGIQETAFGVQYNCMAHNTLRGAAGASVLNGELLARDGYL